MGGAPGAGDLGAQGEGSLTCLQDQCGGSREGSSSEALGDLGIQSPVDSSLGECLEHQECEGRAASADSSDDVEIPLADLQGCPHRGEDLARDFKILRRGGGVGCNGGDSLAQSDGRVGHRADHPDAPSCGRQEIGGADACDDGDDKFSGKFPGQGAQNLQRLGRLHA